MKHIYIFLLLVIVYSCSNSNKIIVSPKDYLEEVFKIIEEHSINRDSVDFQELRKTTFAKFKDIDSLEVESCYPIVKSILKELKDNHSFLMRKEQVLKWKSTSKKKENNQLITFNCKRLNQDIGYVEMKGFSSGDSISIQNYADSLQNKIN